MRGIDAIGKSAAFADFVESGRWNGIPEHESLDVAEMLDALRRLVRESSSTA